MPFILMIDLEKSGPKIVFADFAKVQNLNRRKNASIQYCRYKMTTSKMLITKIPLECIFETSFSKQSYVSPDLYGKSKQNRN